MIRKAYLFVALFVIGFGFVFTSDAFAQNLDKRVSTVEQRLEEHLKNARKARRGGGRTTVVTRDNVARKGVDDLKKIIQGPDGNGGLTKDVADNKSAIETETQNRTDGDTFLAGEIARVEGLINCVRTAVTDSAREHFWMWVAIIVTFIVALIGWFLPYRPGNIFRTQVIHHDDNGGHNPPANPAALHVAVPAANPQAPLGIAGGANPPANPNNAMVPAQNRNLQGQGRLQPILAPAPTITGFSNSVQANQILVSGGQRGTIRGTGFMRGVKVFIGDNECTSVQFQNIQMLTVVTPAGTAGLADIRIVNPDGGEVVMPNAVQYTTYVD